MLPSTAVVMRIENAAETGDPDIAVTCWQTTVWLEVKHAAPAIRSRGVQELTMLRLDHTSHARYVLYCNHDGHKSIHLVRPRLLKWNEPHEISSLLTDTWNHKKVGSFVRLMLEEQRRTP
jgi:hypothetical protein